MKTGYKYLLFSIILVTTTSVLNAQTKLSQKEISEAQKKLPSSRPMITKAENDRKVEAMRAQARKNEEEKEAEAADKARQKQSSQPANKQ